MPTIRFLPESPVFGSPPPIASGTTGNNSNDLDAELLVQHHFPDRKAKAKFGCPGKFTSIEMLDLHQNNCHRRRHASPNKASAAERCSDSMCDVCDKLCVSPKGVAIHKCKAHKTGNKPLLLNCSHTENSDLFSVNVLLPEAWFGGGWVGENEDTYAYRSNGDFLGHLVDGCRKCFDGGREARFGRGDSAGAWI